MKKMFILILVFIVSQMGFAVDSVYLTIGTDAIQTTTKSFSAINVIESTSEVSIIKINEAMLPALSEHMHENFQRCGGYVFHESLEEAKKTLERDLNVNSSKAFNLINYTITEEDRVRTYIEDVSEVSIRATISKLSEFKNRYYQSTTGVESQAWLKGQWEKLVQNRNDVTVEYFKHRSWEQPSIIMTIEGSKSPEEVLIIGGHADSIAGFWGGKNARAPGADDNASGIATITEIIRIAMERGYRPERTVKFMAYAAEEVGLRGSNEIATKFKADGVNVIGVVQFDMTNYQATRDLDIVFMRDYTNASQNEFMGQLVDKYVEGVRWGYSECGYGCSDHASWHNKGYTASMPFESTMGDLNRNIHTDRDTLSASGSNANHAHKFARLGVAFMVEMAK